MKNALLPSSRIKSALINITFIVCAFAFPARAQINLVMNPGFEQYTYCPNGVDLVSYATPWNVIDTTYVPGDTITITCVPDYSNKCVDSNSPSFPWGPFWHRLPRTGDGMMNVGMFGHTNNYGADRDYLQGRLKTNLVPGQAYCVTFYAIIAQSSGWAVNKLGAYFDNGSIDSTAWRNCWLPLTYCHPQMYTNDIIYDTVNWTKVQGSFVANGAERFMTIGNFFSRSETDSMPVPVSPYFSDLWPDGNFMSYYLIDDVSVIAENATAYAGSDRFLSPLGDSVLLGTADGYLPCRWYSGGVVIDSNKAGIKVHPSVTTQYVMELDVCGHITYDTVMIYAVPEQLEEAYALNELIISPNPVSGNKLTVSGLKQPVTYTITNSVGSVVQSGDCNPATGTIGLPTVAPGIYLLTITDVAGNRITRRLQVER